MSARRNNRERGAALVEAPLAIVLVLSMGLGALWIGNVVLRYFQLDKAVEAGVRYGSRAEFAPNDGAQRRRDRAQVVAEVRQAGAPVVIEAADVTVECAAETAGPWTSCDPRTASVARPGTFLKVRATAVVAHDDPVMGLARTANALTQFFGAEEGPFPPSLTLTDSSVALIE